MTLDQIEIGETYIVEISPLMKPFEFTVIFRGKQLMFGLNDEGKESAVPLYYFVKRV